MDPRRLLPYVLALTACAVLITGGAVAVSRLDQGDAPSEGEAAAPAQAGARQVLADWDERRARAWAEGDPRALTELYVEGSRAGEADVRMLQAYADRGLRVDGLTTQVLALDVLAESATRIRLRVVDRMVGGVAVDVESPSRRSRLPADRPTRRTLTLRRTGEQWQMVSVRDQPSDEASTSRTSSSSKS